MDGTAYVSTGQNLPQNEEAEQALLAAILVNNEAYHRVADFLKPEHFFFGVHGRIFLSCSELIAAGRVANPVTLKNMHQEDEALREYGGQKYLADLLHGVVSIFNAVDYGQQIYDCWMRRGLMSACAEAAESARRFDRPSTEITEELESQLFQLTSAKQTGAGPKRISQGLSGALILAERAYKAGGKILGVTTGFADLDRKLGGLIAPDLIVLGGRPSMGKSELAVNIAFNTAKSGEGTVALFSLEMGSEQVAQRVLARLSQISADRQRHGDLTEQDFTVLLAASREAEQFPIWIDETPALGVAQIRNRARRLARKEKLALVVIDHLQLMRQSAKQENRRLEIGEITGGLKALAKELNVPVLLLSQLSRSLEQRDDKRPVMSDLRESGDIEQDADVVMFLYRAEYYLSREEPRRKSGEDAGRYNERQASWEDEMRKVANLAEIIIAKQRMGPTGAIKLRFNAERSLFENYAYAYQEGM